MKNRFLRILSLVCALAVLFAMLPAAYSEEGETPDAAVTEEQILPDETPEERHEKMRKWFE